MRLRDYQEEAVNSVYDYLRAERGNPCVVIPTGGGKTPVISKIAGDATRIWGGRVLILAHVKELLEQSVEKLQVMFPELWTDIGVYSAGLSRRDKDKRIIVGGIQSVFRRACELGRFDLILIDEAHLLPPDGEGMYRTFLNEALVVNPYLRVVGFTATPYRMTTGLICSEQNILTKVVFEVFVKDLIDRGYLSPLITKAGAQKPEFDSLHSRAGEFIPSEINAMMDTKKLVASACREIVEQNDGRKSCLVFCSGIEHAEHVAATLRATGKTVATIFGETLPFERAETLQRFKHGEIKYLVNVDVLTTGFDAPNVDCVALLRPTLSPGLYYQMVGRGFRIAPGKHDCLVLDFGGNVLRHGPVDAIRIENKRRGEGLAPTKECFNCHLMVAAGFRVCPECGAEFPPNEESTHDSAASTAAILSGAVSFSEHEVEEISYHLHKKKGSPADAPISLRVDYQIGLTVLQSEWVCFEHDGYAREAAVRWWRTHAPADLPCPSLSQDAYDVAMSGRLCEAYSIRLRHVSGERFSRIVSVKIGGPKITPARPASWADEVPF